MKESIRKNKEAYDRIARDWHNDHRTDTFDWWKGSTDAFVALLPKSGTVLDAGCAGGQKMKYLRAAGLSLTGVDISEKFLDIIREEQPGVPVYQADLNDLSAVPGEYDGVYASAAILHIEKADVPKVLGQLVSKLKSGGHLYISVKGMREDRTEESYITEDDVSSGPYERFFGFFTLDELKSLLSAAGLAVVYEKSEQVGRSNWIQVIGKRR